MKKGKILGLEGHFTKIKNATHLIETEEGCFVWSDPSSGGNGSLSPYEGSYADLCEEYKVDEGLDLGSHLIGDFCGPQIRLLSRSHH